MARNTGCWANVLDDCEGPLTGEHLISVAVWDGANGVENRRARLGRRVTVEGGPLHLAPRPATVRNLTADILCERHNNSTNDLDTEAGRLRTGIIGYQQSLIERERDPARNWTPRIYRVNGPLLERWLIKTAINNARGFNLPIGGLDAQPGLPTRELVEMVYGLRPIKKPVGMFAVSAVGHTHSFDERFTLMYFDRRGGFLAGCLLRFRTLCLGVQFDQVPIPRTFTDDVDGLQGSTILPVFRGFDTQASINVFLRIEWPEPAPTM